MSKGQPKETLSKKSKLISSLMRELLDWSKKGGTEVVTLRPINSMQGKEHDTQLLDFEDKISDRRSLEDQKSEEQLSQSTISGRPSPFIGSAGDLNIIRPLKRETMIRNKSWDNF